VDAAEAATDVQSAAFAVACVLAASLAAITRPHAATSGRRRSLREGTVRGQNRQVVDEDDPARRGAIAQAGRDRREVQFELLEALVGRAGVPEPGDTCLDARQRRQWPGQAREREPGHEADIVAVGGNGDQAGVRRYGVSWAAWPLADGRRMSLVIAPEKVTSCRSSPSLRATRCA
jgi:hypothetical protein